MDCLESKRTGELGAYRVCGAWLYSAYASSERCQRSETANHSCGKEDYLYDTACAKREVLIAWHRCESF